MKILITGRPRIGKTTLLETFINQIPDKQGFVTRQILEDDTRVGFELVSSTGDTVTLATRSSTSPTRVASYGVEVAEIDAFAAGLPPLSDQAVVYVDEIGQMQLLSSRLKQQISNYLNAQNFFIGTITNDYTDDFIEEILSRNDVVLLTVDADNRDQVVAVLKSLALNVKYLDALSQAQAETIISMARDYAASDQYTQLHKMISNTLRYVAECRVRRAGDLEFNVVGRSKNHVVIVKDRSLMCDCHLFNGLGKYSGHAGECSHIQSTKVMFPDLIT